ncbi:hypothetical protein [Halorhabdus amylolytica]|uniref:hypothetical protein n=1 Tax=Halorhabdus amylolytica TaxID=2559573 RepID=UPI0010AA0AA1|nr:hypothetical protein [Halorhabdus amylolytica]
MPWATGERVRVRWFGERRSSGIHCGVPDGFAIVGGLSRRKTVGSTVSRRNAEASDPDEWEVDDEKVAHGFKRIESSVVMIGFEDWTYACGTRSHRRLLIPWS